MSGCSLGSWANSLDWLGCSLGLWDCTWESLANRTGSAEKRRHHRGSLESTAESLESKTDWLGSSWVMSGCSLVKWENKTGLSGSSWGMWGCSWERWESRMGWWGCSWGKWVNKTDSWANSWATWANSSG